MCIRDRLMMAGHIILTPCKTVSVWRNKYGTHYQCLDSNLWLSWGDGGALLLLNTFIVKNSLSLSNSLPPLSLSLSLSLSFSVPLSVVYVHVSNSDVCFGAQSHFHCQTFHEGWSHYPPIQSWYREVIELTAGAWSCDLSATVLMLYWLTYPGICNSLQQVESIPCQCI